MANQRVRTDGPGEEIARMVNRGKSRVRWRVEFDFAVVKRLWRFNKVRVIAEWPRTLHVRLS